METRTYTQQTCGNWKESKLTVVVKRNVAQGETTSIIRSVDNKKY